MGFCQCLGMDDDTPCLRAILAGAHRAHRRQPPVFARRCGVADLERWVPVALR
jgi:hypothetical protein